MKTFLIFVLVFFTAGEVESEERALQKFTPTINYYAIPHNWGSVWGGVLDLALGDKLFLDSRSSQPKGFASRLYDGNPGSLTDPTGTFLIFDKQNAVLRVVVPDWRIVKSFGFYSLEALQGSKASVSLIFKPIKGAEQRVALKRKTVDQKNGVAHVKYFSSHLDLNAKGGEFVLTYDNPDFSSAFVGELVVNDIGDKALSEMPASTHALWKCPPERKLNCANPLLEQVLNTKKAGIQPDIMYWNKTDIRNAKPSTLHTLLLRTAATGDKQHDITAAWLAYPSERSKHNIPLVMLVSDPSIPDSSIELLGFEGRPEFALVRDLVKAGFAVLVVSQALNSDLLLQENRLRLVLNQVLHGHFAKHAKLDINKNHVGVWGVGQGALLAMLASIGDPRYQAVILSRMPSCSNAFMHRLCGGSTPAGYVLDGTFLQALSKRNLLIIDAKAGSVGAVPNAEFMEVRYPIPDEIEKERIIRFFAEKL